MTENQINTTAIDMGVAIIVTGLKSNKVTILAPDDIDSFNTKQITIACDELENEIIVEVEDEETEYFGEDQFGNLSTKEFFSVFVEMYLGFLKESTELIYEVRNNKYYLLENN